MCMNLLTCYLQSSFCNANTTRSCLVFILSFCPVLQTAASKAREQVLAQVSAAREALEEEEQRLLEQVQREEERVEQCLLTQRAHWSQALGSLAQTRSRLVHKLTHTPDAQLAVRNWGYCSKQGDFRDDGAKISEEKEPVFKQQWHDNGSKLLNYVKV